MRKIFTLSIVVIIACSFNFAQQITRAAGSPFPASSIPDSLYITASSLSASEKFVVGSLSGILAKTKPMIIMEEASHVNLARNSGLSIKYFETYRNDLTGLLRKFSGRVNGYILCNPQSSSSNAAASLSGVLNAVAVPTDVEAKAIAAGLTLLLDVTDKDEAWVLENYGHLFNKDIAFFQPYDGKWFRLVDYTAFTGGFRFFDPVANGSLSNNVYDFLNQGATFFGWWLTEDGTVGNMSRKSFKIIPSDQVLNMSTFTNMPVPIQKQKEAITPYKVVPDVHTVCFVISDGDNITWPGGAYNDLWTWKNDNQSRVNLGWTLSPALIDLAPLIYNNLVGGMQTTPEGRNVIIAGPSGLGYYFPSLSPNQAFHCNQLNDFMRRADMNIVNVIDADNGAHNPDEYLKQSYVDALFYYTYGAQYTGMRGKISWYKGKPSIGGRFTLWGNSTDRSAATQERVVQGLVDVVKNQSTDIYAEAGYSLIPVHAWTMNVHDVANFASKAGPNIRIVAPDEFVWLIKKNLGNLPMGTGTGLKGEYFSGMNFETLVDTRIDKKIDFEWGTGAGITSAGVDNFSIRWSGQIQPLYSEEYTFYITSDDGARLTINGVTLFDALQVSGLSVNSGKITLAAGEKYDIVVEYREDTGVASCVMEWESSSHVRQVVPFTQLYSNPMSTTGLVTVYDDNDMSGFSAGLGIGSYTAPQLELLGIQNNNISSVKLMEGFKAIVYANDNFTGDSLEIISNVNELSDVLMSDNATSWDDKIASIRIVANGDTTLSGAFMLFNVGSNYYMDVVGGLSGTGYNTNIQQYNRTNQLNQTFEFQHLGDGVYTLMARHSKMVLSVAKMGADVGANVHQWKYLGSDSQKFIAVPTETNAYKFISVYSGMVVAAASSANESNIQMSSNVNQATSKWILVKTASREGSGDGLMGEYYTGKTFRSHVFTRVDPEVFFNWGNASPGPGMPNDNFCIRWTGYVEPRYSGEYTFYITSDNGRRLWVNNQLIIDKWISDYDITYSGTINLNQLTKYNIKIEYFEEIGGANIRLEWSSNLETREVIPQSQLYSEEVTISTPKVKQSQIAAYPNPVRNTLYVSGLHEPVRMEIYTAQGSKVIETTGMSVDTGLLSPGLYFLYLKKDGEVQTCKFIKE